MSATSEFAPLETIGITLCETRKVTTTKMIKMESWSEPSKDDSVSTQDTHIENESSKGSIFSFSYDSTSDDIKENPKYHQHSRKIHHHDAQHSSSVILPRFSSSIRPSAQNRSSSKISFSSNSTFSPRLHVHKPSLAPSRSILVRRQESNCEEKRTSKKQVFFATTEVREYEQILGDNPCTLDGPPISLGWRYDAEDILIITVDDYERNIRRPCVRRDNVAPWICADILPRFEREEILLSVGYTQSQLAAAIRAKRKITNQRRQTLVNLKAAKMEEIIEGAGRKLRNMLLPGSSGDSNNWHLVYGRRQSNEYNF